MFSTANGNEHVLEIRVATYALSALEEVFNRD